MCGICGVYNPRADDPAALLSAVARMTPCIAHRGPDDEGVWVDRDGRAALGNRRLAIIDLSPAGHQPMSDASGDVVLTYNGEIYNHPALRDELVALGYRFRGHSDTEVILALYLREGAGMLRRLRGMFALALWDGRTRSLLLARDRLGIKPLYYARAGDRWVFASEVRGLRASGLLPARVNPAAVAAYLRLGSVPSPMTILNGVLEVPPATALLIRNDRADTRRYWEIPIGETGPRDPETAGLALRSGLRDAVASHLISDVPVGVFLSGGVDSTAIVSLMRESGHQRVRTFSITFPEAAFNEGGDAARTAAQYETDHTAHEVRGEHLVRDLDRIIESMDQPTVDGVNTYYVSEVTRCSGTIVALSGLGGDELFCGYPSFTLVPKLLGWQQALARTVVGRPLVAAALAAVPAPRSAKLREALGAPPDVRTAYLGVRGLFTRAELLEVLSAEPLRNAARDLDAGAALGALAPELPDDPVSATGVLELRGYMHNQLLRDTDAMSMAHSLEVRVPFLDHPLVEFAATLPLSLRMNGDRPKWLLTKALGDLLPAVPARQKRGFTFPIGAWLRGPLAVRAAGELHNGRLFNLPAVTRLWRRVQTGHVHWSRAWALVVLGLWLEQHKLSEAWQI